MADANFHVETPRLYLSYLQPSLDAHCDFFVRLYNSPAFVAAIGSNAGIVTREDARERIATRFVTDHARNGYGQFLISAKPDDDDGAAAAVAEPFPERLARCRLVGAVSLMRGRSAASCTAPDVGFAILPEETRKGYAKEAAAAIIEWARRERGVDVVFGFTNPANGASKAVFRSLGFEDRGVMTLADFGGAGSAVWVSPGAPKDLSAYNL